MKNLTVVIDRDSSNECLYVDGKAWASKGETTVYATDIAEVAGDEPIVFRHIQVDCPDDWPDNLTDLKRTDGEAWNE